MGLKYSSSDSSELISGLTSNIKMANLVIEELNKGSKRLTDAVDDKKLSGEAYKAGKGIFANWIVPAIKLFKEALDDLQKDLDKYKSADALISGEGYLDEDLIKKQLEIKKAMKLNADVKIQYFGSAASSDVAAGRDDTAFLSTQSELMKFSRSVETDIKELQKKLEKLYTFKSNVGKLFKESTDLFKTVNELIYLLSSEAITNNGQFSSTMVAKQYEHMKRFVIGLSWCSAGNKAKIESIISLKMIMEGKYHGAPSKVTKSGLKTWKQVMADVKKYKFHKKSASLDELLNGKGFDVSKIKALFSKLKNLKSTKVSNISKGLKTSKGIKLTKFSNATKGIKGAAKSVGVLGAVGAVADGVETYNSEKKKYGTKTAVVDGVAHTGISGTATAIGGTVGSLIPVPVLGTLAGAAVGYLVGNIASSVYDETRHRKDHKFFSRKSFLGW
ncbi:MAG: LXG domain-containing protein [Lachnospiraceae bacterium]|jgi:hypothetical protein|nr:LXG domain-containing protein [Lachnospiraceae bacterium]